MVIASGRHDRAFLHQRPRRLRALPGPERCPRRAELTVFCGGLTGACLGFLWYNAHPAEIFMGDVGSLALGGCLGVVAVLIKQEILLLFVGGVFVLEALSVILQVASFKLRRQADLQDGAAAPSFRGARLAGIQDHRAVLDRRAGDGAVCADDVEAEVRPWTSQACACVVVGLGRSGRAAVALLCSRGALVRATDLKPQPESAALERLRALNVEFRLQTPEVFENAEWIVLSPGVPADLPELAAARARGVRVIGEVELASYYLQGPVLGVTGSNGKTTTTALAGHICAIAALPRRWAATSARPFARWWKPRVPISGTCWSFPVFSSRPSNVSGLKWPWRSTSRRITWTVTVRSRTTRRRRRGCFRHRPKATSPCSTGTIRPARAGPA
jgi:hypothetical protein